MSQRAVLWCWSEMGNTEDLIRQNQVLSFCKEQGMKAVRAIIEYGKADILKLRNFRQMARYDECDGGTDKTVLSGQSIIGGCKFGIVSSVTEIEDVAFHGCESLAEMNYNRTMAEWKTIYIGYRSFLGVKANVVHCVDGDVDISE